jgi:flagellar hook assembly protein FlgD
LRPDLYEDGIYELIVQARDASGNDAGDYAYYVSFKVTHDKSVSHIYNFPNPFRTSTRFIYTLTGESSPAFYQIQILSVTGVVVREITSDELGPLAVGTHMTEYEWDGTDDNGNVLAGGTYFYHMIVRDENQQDYKLYQQSSGGQVTRHDWGKLVILR